MTQHEPAITVQKRNVHEVFFYIHTHTALRSEQFEGESTADRKAPGITLRDVRLAILVEQLFIDAHLSGKGGIDTMPALLPASQRPESIRLIERTAFPKRRPSTGSNKGNTSTKSEQARALKPCPACKGTHAIRDCPDRLTITPDKPCTNCGGAHWRLDCPEPAKPKDARVPVGRKQGNRSPSPPSPCPLCGGDHWKSDCVHPSGQVVPPILPIP